MSASRVCRWRSTVREWQIVTVAWACEQEVRDRLPDDDRPADHDCVGSLDRDLVLGEHAHDPERRAGDECGTPEVEPPGVHGVNAVDVLRRIHGLDRFRLVDVAGQRQLHEEAVHSVVGVQVCEESQELGLGGVRGQTDVPRLDADGLSRPLLEVDVDLGRRVVSDEHGGETDVAELGDFGGHFAAHLGRQRLAVDDGCGHRAEVT